MLLSINVDHPEPRKLGRAIEALEKGGVIAYPTVYGSSGVMTFVTGPDDSVRQKDLGANTPRVASAITAAGVDATWVAAEPSLQGSAAP